MFDPELLETPPDIIDENEPKPVLGTDFFPEAIAPTSRRTAREIALKASYAMEMRACTMEEALADPLITEGNPPPPFTVTILQAMESNRFQLDNLIRERVERWEFVRVALLDRLVLRMGVAELFHIDEVPPKVTINEAIEIAKKYSTDSSSRFVNGVLDSIYTDLCGGTKRKPRPDNPQ